MKRALRLLSGLVLSLVLTGAFPAHADGYRNPPATAAALAGAGAGYAWGDGASAISTNPAGLMDLERPESNASATLTRLRADFKPAAAPGLKLSSRDQWHLLTNLYAGGPGRDGTWAWGFGLAPPYGQSVRWRTDDPAPWRYARPYEASMMLLEAAPAFAVRLNDRLVFGAALSLYYSELEFKQAAPSAAILPALAGPDFDIRFDEDTTAIGGTVGLHWQAAEAVRLALSYTSPVRLRYSGDAQIRHPWFGSEMTDGFLASRIRARIDLPDIAALAVGVSTTENTRVELAVERLFWSRQDQPSVEMQGPMAPPPAPRQSWDDAWTAGLAGEWKTNENWTLRGGYRFMQTPIPDDLYDLVLADSDRHVLGIGIGYTRGAHEIDLAWSYNWLRSRQISGHPNPAIDGRHSYRADLAGLTYRYRY